MKVHMKEWYTIAEDFEINVEQAIQYFSKYEKDVIAALEGDHDAWWNLNSILSQYTDETLMLNEIEITEVPAGRICSEDDQCG